MVLLRFICNNILFIPKKYQGNLTEILHITEKFIYFACFKIEY